MGVMTLETLNEFEEVGAVRIREGKRNGHNPMFLKGIVDGINM